MSLWTNLKKPPKGVLQVTGLQTVYEKEGVAAALSNYKYSDFLTVDVSSILLILCRRKLDISHHFRYKNFR